MAERSPYTGEKLVEGVNADRRGGRLRARDPYEGMYKEATKALTDYATSLQTDQPKMESDITAQGDVQRRTTEQQRQAGLGTIGTQRQQATRQTESAIAEARRIASEQMQGLQARFGTATGTGGFTGEIMGRETARGIESQRGGLQQTMNELDMAERDLITRADNQIFQIDTQVNQAINESRRQLRDQLAQINLQKGQLEADKAQRRIQALQNYQLTLRQLEAQRENQRMAIEADAQSALRNFEFEKALIAERARYGGGSGGTGRSGGTGGVGITPSISGAGENPIVTNNPSLNRMLQLGFRPTNASIAPTTTRTTDQGVSTGYGF